jgi:PIN like domain
MKAQFPEYYRPNEEEFRVLWETCIVGVDANVLLNIYGYSDATREQLLSLLERIQARIRMPHQFALEYQRNRANAIMQQVKNYVKVERQLNEIYREEFRPRTKHPFLSSKSLKLFEVIRNELDKGRKQHEALLSQDPYFDRITKLVGTVSPTPTEGELQTLHEDARARYARNTPPGYADLKEKGEPAAYGDFIGWMQLIMMAKAENRPLLLLTDDAKEDWWQMQGDRTIGPRPELRAEFQAQCGHAFYMYSSDQFMRLAGKYLKQEVEQAAIDEVSERLLTQLRESSAGKSGPKPTEEASNLAKPASPFMQEPAAEPKAESAKPVEKMSEDPDLQPEMPK